MEHVGVLMMSDYILDKYGDRIVISQEIKINQETQFYSTTLRKLIHNLEQN